MPERKIFYRSDSQAAGYAKIDMDKFRASLIQNLMRTDENTKFCAAKDDKCAQNPGSVNSKQVKESVECNLNMSNQRPGTAKINQQYNSLLKSKNGNALDRQVGLVRSEFANEVSPEVQKLTSHKMPLKTKQTFWSQCYVIKKRAELADDFDIESQTRIRMQPRVISIKKSKEKFLLEESSDSDIFVFEDEKREIKRERVKKFGSPLKTKTKIQTLTLGSSSKKPERQGSAETNNGSRSKEKLVSNLSISNNSHSHPSASQKNYQHFANRAGSKHSSRENSLFYQISPNQPNWPDPSANLGSIVIFDGVQKTYTQKDDSRARLLSENLNIVTGKEFFHQRARSGDGCKAFGPNSEDSPKRLLARVPEVANMEFLNLRNLGTLTGNQSSRLIQSIRSILPDVHEKTSNATCEQMLELGIGTNPMFQPKDYNELCMEYKTFRRDSLIRDKNENADVMLK
jgi:hypothetical protein